MEKKILITGGTGFIGANLVRKLTSIGYKPVLLIRKNSNIWRLKDIKNKVVFIESEILNKPQLNKIILKIKPNIIYHLAVYGTIVAQQRDINEAIDVNITGTMNLLEASRKAGCEYFINTGSSTEYGQKEHILKETDLPNPSTFYGATKAAATLLVQEYAKSYDMSLAILRLFSPYGYYDKDRFIPSVILHALQNKHLDLSSPDFVRDFIFIDDILEVYLYFLSGKKYFGEIFNIGMGQQRKLKEVVQIIENHHKKKIDISWGKKLPHQFEAKKWEADIDKAEKLLNWKPRFGINEGLFKTYTWFRQHLKLYNSNL